ncbi:MAG TPA: DUF3341 domain-containing protein [Vicinamibacterales bacterium]|nr:DUF3341 domain-containing protein [Vicinamibacterales bacterium]
MTVLLEFATAEGAVHAVRTLTAVGYLDIETHAPFPLTEDEARGRGGSFPIAPLALGAGVVAMAAAYFIQWYANVWSYPIDTGGRPLHAGPAFVPTVFETIGLIATLAAFFGFLLLERLPRLWQPLFDVDGFERSAVDRFWLELETDDTVEAVDRVTRDAMPLEPLRIVIGSDT